MNPAPQAGVGLYEEKRGGVKEVIENKIKDLKDKLGQLRGYL